MHYRDALMQSQILSKQPDGQWFHMQLDAMGLDNVHAKIFWPAKAPLFQEPASYCGIPCDLSIVATLQMYI